MLKFQYILATGFAVIACSGCNAATEQSEDVLPFIAGGDIPTICTTSYLENLVQLPDRELEESKTVFSNYRYDLIVKDYIGEYVVPGYFTGQNFTAIWVPRVSLGNVVERRLCRGKDVAVSSEDALESHACESVVHNIVVGDVSIGSCGLSQRNSSYLLHHDGSVFLKTGAGSPENILAYADFDGTYDAGGTTFPSLGESQLHKFEAHLKDARPDDPTWGEGKGAALLGLFNYYEEVGVNSQYLVGMNVHGDGWDVFPWASHDDPYVFDVSKLAQWQTVFEHANRRGVAIHFLFTETENESFFEVYDGVDVGSDFAPSRKLYYREMVARFGHLPMIIWNLGEENGVVGNSGADPYRQPTSPQQRLDFSDYIASLDARNHPIISHNWPNEEEALFGPKLGHPTFSGISLQAHEDYFDKVVEWTRRSAEAGRPWMITVDEPLGWEFGAKPDANAERREEILTVLWPSLMGGAAGVEWYFGWQNNAPTSDLSNEDQRSRNQLWTDSARVREFFETLPLTVMSPERQGDTIILEGGGYRLEMTGQRVRFTEPGQSARMIDPYDPE